jgi:hypothetical protein
VADRPAYAEAFRIQRRSELVLMTGWTFEQLNRQSRIELTELLDYNRIKSALQTERDNLERNRKH